MVTEVAGLERFLERRLRTTGLVTAGLAAAATVLSASPQAPAHLAQLDAEADARTPSPAQRIASRAQGRGLLRTAKAAWAAPSTTLSWTDLGARPHHPVVLGCACAAGGVSAQGAALAAAYLSVSAPSTAAQRLLALDPVSVAAVTVRLGPAIEQIAAAALLSWGSPDSGQPESHPGTNRTKTAEAGHNIPAHTPPGPPIGATPPQQLDLTKADPAAVSTGPDQGAADVLDLALLPDDSDPLLDLLAERHAAREERLFAS
nr:urease accessory UreF family protein [Kineosporia babensis]